MAMGITFIKKNPSSLQNKIDKFYSIDRLLNRYLMTLSLILASQSPRRKELLTQVGYTFSSIPADINEAFKINENAVEYVQRLAIEKAKAVAENLTVSERELTVILGSDTSVVYKDNILGKPSNFNECKEQLQMLSGNTHQVLTSIAGVHQGNCLSEVIATDVTFKNLTLGEITRYWATGEPQDKAGSYGIQGLAGQFVTNISGSYSAVVGLPLFETTKLLSKLGITTPIQLSLKEDL